MECKLVFFQFEEDQQVTYQYQDGSQKEQQHYPPKPYQILPQSALFIQLMRSVEKVKELTSLEQGWCFILLNQFKWNTEFLNDKYFSNSNFYKKKIGFNSLLKDPLMINQQQIGTCAVCCKNQKLRQYICGDKFCLSCWLEHLSTNIKSNNLFMKCMGCQVPLIYQSIKIILNINNNGEKNKLFVQYERKLCELFVTINNSYQFCVGTDCTYFIKSINLSTPTVRCYCGTVFCFLCKEDNHSPCSCQEKKKWTELVLKQQATAQWLSNNTKICPWCHKAVQRLDGCNFMACLCGKTFCYMCSKPWQPDHKDHFKCHIYMSENNRQQSKQKEILALTNFYAQKYLNNNAITKHLKKMDTFERRRFLYNVLDVELNQSQFIDLAYRFAIQCCSTLQWIYAYSYFIKFKNKQQKLEFLLSQGQFQKYKEQLLKMLSYDLKQYFNSLEEKFYGSNRINKNLQIQTLAKLKKRIVNYQSCTKKFKEKFLKQIQEMSSIIIKKKKLKQFI